MQQLLWIRREGKRGWHGHTINISFVMFVLEVDGIRWRIVELQVICKLCRGEGLGYVEVVVFDCLGLEW